MPALWRRLHPYLLLTLLALPALWPLTAPGLARTNDDLPHFYRALELAQLFRAGVLLPRWAPDLVLGFGYPVFNFFPYEAHALVAGLNLLGLPLLTAYKAATALVLLLAVFGAYRLAREHFGPAAGLIAGLAYLYSPYLLYDTYMRGSLPEALALAWLPTALLYLRRAVRGGRRADQLLAALTLAAAILAHQGVMLQVMPLGLAYTLWQWWPNRPRGLGRAVARKWLTLARLFGPFALALGLAAFFLLPALAEAPYVQIARGTGNGAMSYVNNFLSLGDLLAQPRLPVDPDLLNPPVVRSLPLLALGLAALAWLRWLRAPAGQAQRRNLAALTLLAVAALLLMLPIARPLWDALPLLQLTLFPWRLLGPISLFTALVAGALFAAPAQPELPRNDTLTAILLGLAALTLVLSGLPFASPPREAVPAAPTLADLAAFEMPPDFIGTTTVGEYLPAWVTALPDLKADRAQLMQGAPVPRFDAPGAEVSVAAGGPTGATFSVTASAPFTFTYRVFYFPGWTATLDGRAVPVTITTPSGLMAVPVPAGTHTLAFAYAGTLIQHAALLLSLAVLLGLAFTLWRNRREPGAPAVAAALPPALAHPAAFALAAALALARPLLYDAGLTPLLRPGLAAAAEHGLGGLPPLNLDVAGELTLLAAGVTPHIGGDEAAAVTLYWQATHPLGVAYGFDVRLVDAAGHTWSEPAPTRPRDWRFTPGTDRWPAAQYILDPYLVTPLAGTPPGDYTAQVTVFAYYNLQAVATLPIGTVTIDTPTRARACLYNLFETPHPALNLYTAAADHASAAPGDDVTVNFCWQFASPSVAAISADLTLLDADGRLRAAQPFNLGGPHAAGPWADGDVLRDQVIVRLPADLETGDYHWALTVADGAPLTFAPLAVTAPERIYAPPPGLESVAADLGPVTLFGLLRPATPVAPGGAPTLTLVWRADELLATSFHVFVHLLAADGTLVAQSDGVPADWTRRTTGWLPGEFVRDLRALPLPADLPPGDYALWAGLYDPATGLRLTPPAYPDGRVPLGTLRVTAAAP